MRYQVRFVEDRQLPSANEFVFARFADEAYLFIKQSAIDPETGSCDAVVRAWVMWESGMIWADPAPQALRAV